MRPRRHVLFVALDPGAADALGQLLLERHDELQLAPAAGARGDPRLRGGARGRAPRGPRPLAALLAAARVTVPGLPRARALAAGARACFAALAAWLRRRWRRGPVSGWGAGLP